MTILILMLLTLGDDQPARAGLLDSFALTNVIDVGAARLGIAIGGVLYDPAVDGLLY